MRKLALPLLLVIFATTSVAAPADAFDYKQFKTRHPGTIGAAKGATTGARIGTFVGMPWLGAGLGAAVGGVAHFFHRHPSDPYYSNPR